MRNLPEFLVELRRRRVFRAAAVYLVAGWGVLQVADLAFASWGIPATALRNVWIALVLGFPLLLFLAWRYDVARGRIVRAAGTGGRGDLSLTRTDYAVAATCAAVAIITVYGLVSEISAVSTGPEPGPAANEADPRSIAVLPFESTSDGEGDASFLALGIQDDLLTRLSRIDGLKVISRTSVERYRDSPPSTSAIARELGVGKLVEGRIQRSGDQVRINVQLIDSVADQHLWAATYDRDLTAAGVFSIQSEVVETIARQLQATLTPAESDRLTRMPTQSLAAYTAYLKGQQQANLVSIQSLTTALEFFEEAIRLDPDFTLAHVGLADAYLALGSNFHGGLPTEESIALAEPPLRLALSLDPNVGEAHATLGLLRYLKGDMDGAEAAYERAIRLAPSYSYAYRLYGRLRWHRGERDDAIRLAERALELDPFYAPANFDVARYNDVMGNFDEALERYLRVVEIRPDYAFAYVYIAAIYYLVHGRVDESLVWYHRAAQADALSPSLRAAPAIAFLELGDVESARPWVESGLELGPKTFWSRWASTLLNLAEGKRQAALADARVLLETYPRFSFALRLLRDADLDEGRPDVALARYSRAHRELVEGELPAVDAGNYRSAIDLALVLKETGDDARAADLLELSLRVVEDLPRLGTDGFWINDARIYALQGRTDAALAAIRTATQQGWRVLTWYFLEEDPNLESLRDLPEFLAIRKSIRADLTRQAENLAALRASGELAAAAARH